MILVASTRAAAGIYEDRSGPILEEFLSAHGLHVTRQVLPDAQLADALPTALSTHPDVLLISGGTGITPDDRSVEALAPHLDLELPGVAHAFYGVSAAVATAALSRTVAGIAGRTFCWAIPGSTGAAKDACRVLEPLLEHLLNQLEGNRDH
ncbi:MogA/MoaB family molybdenum cofactor biosynthesis protein [Corynebacterium phocae]|nr:MogA/MoaB family molybdenum cofactor biosynthesis protein [Corynebacterium phocae]